MQPLSENAVNVPAFLSKLWKMVNDPKTDHLISWSPSGNSFIIQNQLKFWFELLPSYYKHNNMSSFVRQLNMYGFHKMSTFENGTMDTDKGEIQFYHPYFQKDSPELLKNIKRKVTASKSENVPQNIIKTDDLAKVLADVKHLRGRQASVDSQLNAMKQENAVLWRELAMLRQKHLKQQQIVNKLIQFLVTLVQPTRMGNFGVKRRLPLMLNESPQKRSKTKSGSSIGDGPTIHELDNADIITEDLLVDDTIVGQLETDIITEDDKKVHSPKTPNTTTTSVKDGDSPSPSTLLEDTDSINPDILWENPELIYVKDGSQNVTVEDFLTDNDDAINNTLQADQSDVNEDEKVFLNPSTQDTLLSNLINGSYNTNALSGKGSDEKRNIEKNEADSAKNSMVAVATPNIGLNRLTSVDDLDLHLESTQSELDQLKDILNGCASFVDANALLGLFTDEYPEYALSYSENKEMPETEINEDPFISGSELTTYDAGNIDFSELFDTSDMASTTQIDSVAETTDESINTPVVIKSEPQFPSSTKTNKK